MIKQRNCALYLDCGRERWKVSRSFVAFDRQRVEHWKPENRQVAAGLYLPKLLTYIPCLKVGHEYENKYCFKKNWVLRYKLSALGRQDLNSAPVVPQSWDWGGGGTDAVEGCDRVNKMTSPRGLT